MFEGVGVAFEVRVALVPAWKFKAIPIVFIYCDFFIVIARESIEQYVEVHTSVHKQVYGACPFNGRKSEANCYTTINIWGRSVGSSQVHSVWTIYVFFFIFFPFFSRTYFVFL